MDTFVIVELYVFTYEEARLLIGFEFVAINTLGFENREEMTEKLSLAYNKAADLNGMRVAEVGKAFFEYSKTQNKDDLYNADKSHPSPLGSELAAKVIFEAMMKKD